MLGFLK